MKQKRQTNGEKINPGTTALPDSGQENELDQRAVAAGPGNQLQDNYVRPSDPMPSSEDLTAGHSSDSSEYYEPNRPTRIEPVEQADGSSDDADSK